MTYRPAQIRKALVALATAATEAMALGLLDGVAAKWVAVALATLGACGVFAVKNADA